MLNSTDKKKIEKILTDRIEEYKKELKEKNEDKEENKAKEIEENPPKEIKERIEKIKKIAKELNNEITETEDGWTIVGINTPSDEKIEAVLKFSTKTIEPTPKPGVRWQPNIYLKIYDHPEIVKIREKIEGQEKDLEKAGKAATLDIYIGTKQPLEILDELDKKTKEIINR